jgi:TIR domain-containing protein
MAKEQRRPKRVFISYRSRDAASQAQLLRKYFADRYKDKNVFFDTEGIFVGAKWASVIEQQVRDCDVLVAVIGPRWIELIKEYAIEEIDHVRKEIALALEHGKMVAPVCVGGAQKPDVKQMHWQVRPMMAHNAEVLSDPLKDAEIKRLLTSIEAAFSRHELRQVAARLDEISPAAGLALG